MIPAHSILVAESRVDASCRCVCLFQLRLCRSSPAPSASTLASSSTSSAVRTNQVLDATLRGFYRNRNDAFWGRPDTWQAAQQN